VTQEPDHRRSARDAILAAFPDDPAPPLEALRNDHCLECAELGQRFSGKAWSELVAADLAGNPAVSLLTPAGFRYLLPAMMLLSMEHAHELDCLPSSLVHALSPSGGKAGPWLKAVFDGVSPEQLGAIVAFLRHHEAQLLEDRPPVDESELRVVTRAIRYASGLL
jgi:hypothetical protein